MEFCQSEKVGTLRGGVGIPRREVYLGDWYVYLVGE